MSPVTPSSPSPSSMRRLITGWPDDPASRDLAVVKHSDGVEYSRYYQIPKSSDDLLKRSALIEHATATGGTLVVLIKEIGSDALCALMRVAASIDRKTKSSYAGRVAAFYRHCRANDLAVAVAQTDVKGDRSLGPSAQHDPDFYVHIVDSLRDGIVVRGAKAHTSVSTNANEIIVLPTRAMAEADRDYAVSFAVPVATKGLTLLASAYDSAGPLASPVEHPISARHKMMETTTVFEDVFVPWDRVFLAGETEFAGPLALAFVEHHRFTAISYKLPLVDALIGSAMLMADMNGVAKAGHVREKLVQLISYGQTLRGDSLRGDQIVATRTGNLRARSTLCEHGQVPLRARLSRSGQERPGHRGWRTGYRPWRRGSVGGGDSTPLQALLCGPGRGQERRSAPRARARERSGCFRIRHLPGSAGGARRGIARSREVDAPSQLRSGISSRVRAANGGN